LCVFFHAASRIFSQFFFIISRRSLPFHPSQCTLILILFLAVRLHLGNPFAKGLPLRDVQTAPPPLLQRAGVEPDFFGFLLFPAFFTLYDLFPPHSEEAPPLFLTAAFALFHHAIRKFVPRFFFFPVRPVTLRGD